MLCLHRPTARHGKQGLEPILLLSLLVFVALVFVRAFFRDSRPLSQQLFSAFVSALSCFGAFLGLIVLLASAEMLKTAAARFRAHRRAQKLGWLVRWRGDGRLPATPEDIDDICLLLRDGDEPLRQYAFDALFTVLRASPPFASTPGLRAALLDALGRQPGLAQALIARQGLPLLPCVTLGAKLGAGTADKRLAPPTEDPAGLARWALANRAPGAIEEVQVSVGFDTGSFPGLDDRARFIGLWLFIAATELQRFQGLDRRPHRDPNAAYGLIIRGDIVEARCPGQARGHRLDYVFPLPQRDQDGLAELFAQLQALNLGLLLACTEDACRAFFPGQAPPWLDERCRAAAAAYRRFERELVALLRHFGRFRDPDAVHPTHDGDDEERRQATVVFRLEECLYPQYRWVVPLYELDTSWERLLPPLRAVEGMLLHQGDGGQGRTRGAEFIHQARLLGARAAREVLRAAEQGGQPGPAPPPDPFLGPTEEEASRDYLTRVRRALSRGELTPEQLPDPSVFERAEAYYFNSPRESES